MNDRLDINLRDDVLAAEIELVTDLMITANRSDVPLCLHTIDAVLRVPGRTAVQVGQCHCTTGGSRPGEATTARSWRAAAS